MTFGAHILVHSEPFLDYLYELWHCCLRYIATWGKKFHIGAHLHSGPKLYTAFEFSLNLSAIYTKWCAKSFPPILDFSQFFYRNFAKILAPPGDKNGKYVVHLKEQSILKKALKTHQNRPINRHTILVWTMSPTRRQTKRDTQKKHQFSLPTAGAHSSISPKICMLIEHVMTILKVWIIFRSNA